MVNTYAAQSGGYRFESLWGFGFSLKGAYYEVGYCGKKNFLSWTAMHIDFVMCKKIKLCCEYDSVLMNEIKEDIFNTPDDNEFGYLIECNLEYPAEIKEKTKNFPFCPYQTKAHPNLFSGYMNNINQPNYKPTSKLM